MGQNTVYMSYSFFMEYNIPFYAYIVYNTCDGEKNGY